MILESSSEPQAVRINDSGISGVDCGGLYGGNDWNSGWREPGHWDLQNYGRPVVLQLHLQRRVDLRWSRDLHIQLVR
jgi:hypothetical protein